ncbi:MAG: DUF484 family protein [Rhodocyclaceae bacterium]|nr:DUF484 family protein [Rhodocyclaceae bacterium]
MTADDVAAFLQANPDFFEDYHELLAHLNVPHPHGGRTISITERQVLTLREKSRQLETKMVELLRFGEENDAIGEKVHRLSIALASALEADTALAAVRSHLVEDFQVPHVALRLWGTATRIESPEFGTVAVATRSYAAGLKHPYCGPNAGFEAATWFGEDAAQIHSLALVPLRRGPGEAEVVGLLALGSEESERFYAGMGTVFLERIGDLVSASLLRVLG